MATTKPVVSNKKSTVIKIKVQFELNTPDGKRRVLFGLEKDTQGSIVIWKIDFQLFQRAKKTDPFGDPVVRLSVEVQKELHDRAEQASKALTPGQSAHALGPAADDSLAAKAGEIEVEEAQETIENTLRKN
jgi:hypothetical protein